MRGQQRGGYRGGNRGRGGRFGNDLAYNNAGAQQYGRQQQAAAAMQMDINEQESKNE
jgi:hypothetical protein